MCSKEETAVKDKYTLHLSSWAQQIISDLQRQLAEIERLREGLKRLEWIDLFPASVNMARKERCPVCLCSKKETGGDGHDTDCWLAALLEGK